MSVFHEYVYLVVLALVFGFMMAFGIGSNDVANSFGSSVAAGSLSLGWAVVLGSICELVGAVSLGASVAGTIRGKVIDASFYKDTPEIFMLGNTTALMMGSIWLLLATYFQFPVSTTHDIVGAIIGFSLAAYGFDSIVWDEAKKIFISWVAAPIFSGGISFIFFFILKVVVLDSAHTFERGLKTFPVVVFCAITVNLFFVLYKSKNNIKMSKDDWVNKVCVPSAFAGGALAAIITLIFVVPHVRKTVLAAEEEREAKRERDQFEEDPMPAKSEETPKKKINDEEPVEIPPSSLWDRFANSTFRQDLKVQSFHESKATEQLWENSEQYDEKAEHLFSFLQVFTACLASFAHGTNDVANSIAPISSVLDIYHTGVFNSKAPVDKWLLVLGGAGISLGFALFGYRIIKAVGYKLTVISPSRGFCIELAAALAVSVASFMSIPVSTTQCLVGATTGVGLASGGLKAINGFWLLRVLFGWVGLFFCAVIVNAGFFSFTAYSPSLVG